MIIGNFNFIPEYQFNPNRKWRFDYALLDYMIAIEIEGGAWSNGRHTRGKGFINDMEKYNSANVLGWQVLRYTPEQFENYVFLKDINELLKNRNEILRQNRQIQS